MRIVLRGLEIGLNVPYGGVIQENLNIIFNCLFSFWNDRGFFLLFGMVKERVS